MNLNNEDEIFLQGLMAEAEPEDTPGNAPDIWRWPVMLGVLSAGGLICALVGDGWYDVLSWCMLAFPLMVMTRAMRK